MLKKELLEILVCPEDHTPLKLADQKLIDQLNEAVASGTLATRSGEKVESHLEGGLVRKDGNILYPIIDGIPILLVDDSIQLDLLGLRQDDAS